MSKFTAPEFKPYKDYGKVGNKLVHAGIGLISAVEILVLVLGVASYYNQGNIRQRWLSILFSATYTMIQRT